jgi:hypothetical protein
MGIKEILNQMSPTIFGTITTFFILPASPYNPLEQEYQQSYRVHHLELKSVLLL